VPVEHLDAAAPGRTRNVGDDDDRRPFLVEFFQQGRIEAPVAVQVPGRLSASSTGGRCRVARATRPAAAHPRQLGRRAPARCLADDRQGVASHPPLGAVILAYNSLPATLPSALVLGEEELLNTNPIRDARSAANSGPASGPSIR
jgi:hypothetical protein